MKQNRAFSALIALILGGCQVGSNDHVEARSRQNNEPSEKKTKQIAFQVHDVPISDANWQRELDWVDDSAMIDGKTSISTARSVQEAEWLHRHGFLTRSKIDYLRSLGFSEVERLARAGNSDAILFLGEQFIKEGRGDLIVKALNDLIEKDASIPALHLRARYKTSLVTEVPGDLPTDSWQWRDAAFKSSDEKIDVATDYFAAYLLGDYRGAQIATKMFAYEKAGLPPIVYTKAARMVAGMSNSGRSLKLDPRPMPDEARGANDF